MSAVLDTHAVLWYLENSPELSATARTTVEEAVRTGQVVHVSAITLIEIIYLVERQRLPATALHRLRTALADSSAGLAIAPVDAAIASAMENVPRDKVPDMPDRTIAATALRFDAILITRDRQLQSAGIKTIW